jgi:hypothetical protein
MKKTIFLATVCFALGIVCKAQCDKNIKWISSKSEFIDTANGNVDKSKNESVELISSPKKVSILVKGEHPDSMTGDVTNYSCDWNDQQNGKIVFKSTLTDNEGEIRHATITIEKTAGKIIAHLKAEEEPTEIRLTIDSFEEAD